MQTFAVSCAFFLALLLSIAPARASGPEYAVQRALADLNTSRGPEAYTLLRELWRDWGTVDPHWVAQALDDAARSSTQPQLIRDYAAFLGAHARARRGDPEGAKRQIAELGYVDQWIVVGPFDNEGKTGLDTVYGPETQFSEPLVDGHAYSGKERPVRWRQLPTVFQLGWLNGNSLFRPEQNICFYAASFVDTRSQHAERASLLAGAAGAFELFVNGKSVLRDAAYRGHDVDRRGVEVELPPGKSNLTLKACGTDAPPVVSLRVTPNDRRKAPFAISATFRDSHDALVNHARVKVTPTKRLGALDQFEDWVKNRDPARLEMYARYLVVTHGDDPTAHAARDAARSAAEAAPTIERLLLAGRLTEDHNQQRLWVERAEQLAEQQNVRNAAVPLARAQVEQSSLGWRQAFTHYTTALSWDPDSIDAIRGRVVLFNEAGMQRSALHVLRQSVERNPNSVTLLNMYASELRELGYGIDADEVERRYAQFRADDHNYLGRQIDLAIARNNPAAAEYWVGRLLAFNPDSLWAHATAALAYRRMNAPDRAIAAYQTALELAPEDVLLIRALSDLRGERGEHPEQLRLLRRILEIRPQDSAVQEYVKHIEPETPRRDEAYAWEPDRFLKKRGAPADGESQRTLLDLTVATVFENGLGSEFRQVVFQPLVDSAATLNRAFSFHYQADSQRVQLRGARVFRGDGRIDEAIETAISAANDPSIAMYTSARIYTVSFPRLEAGDVVELRYRIDDVSNRNEFDDYFGDIQYLQSTEPIGHSEYVLITPKARQFHIDHRGLPGLEQKVEVSEKNRIFRFWAKDVPAIQPEPLMPPWAEVAGFVHVSTYPSYAELGRWYWGLVRDQFDLDDETRKLAQKITQGLTTEHEKVAAVYNWVIKNTRYVALEFGIYGYKPRRSVQTISRGWGDCKDKATVIVALLEELGIDSTIVVVRTQLRGGFASKVASFAPFDHAIAYVPSLDLYLDGTAEYTGTSELPEMDHEALGILVNQGDAKLVQLPKPAADQDLRARTLKLRLSPTGSVELDAEFSVQGTEAPSWRRRYNAVSTQRERISADLSREFPGFSLLPGEAGLGVELDDFEKPVVIHVKGKAPSYARPDGDNLSLPVTTRVRLLDEYAALSKRSLELKIGQFSSVQERFEVQLPPGMKVHSLPQAVEVDTQFGRYRVKTESRPGHVVVESQLALKVTRVSPADYPAWRAFCQSADNAMNPRLIVGK